MCHLCEEKYGEPGLQLEYGVRRIALMPTPRMVTTLMTSITNRRPGDDDVAAITRALHDAINAAPVLEAPLTTDDTGELAGRMYEAIDIGLGIESGQFKTLADVLHAVKARSSACQQQLVAAGVPLARAISREEFERRSTEAAQGMMLADLPVDKTTAN